MAKDERTVYTIKMENNQGEVVIADEVIAVVAGLAAVEVDGVASMAGNATKELISKLGKKLLSKGVKVDVLEGVVSIAIAINIKYGFNVMSVSKKVQEKVKATVESMTGLTVADVNVRVAGVDVDAE